MLHMKHPYVPSNDWLASNVPWYFIKLIGKETACTVNQRHGDVGQRLQPCFVEGNGLDSSRRDSRTGLRRLVALDPVHPAQPDS